MSSINDVRRELLEQMARLNATGLRPDQLKLEIEKTKAMADIGQVLVNSAKAEVDFIRATKGVESTFFRPVNEVESKPIEISESNVKNLPGLHASGHSQSEKKS